MNINMNLSTSVSLYESDPPTVLGFTNEAFTTQAQENYCNQPERNQYEPIQQ